MDNFNHDFYLAVAAVIPLLYLALTLQGDALKKLVTRLRDTAEALKDAPHPWRAFILRGTMEDLSVGKWFRIAGTWVRLNITATVLPMVAWLILLAGVAGEAVALLALWFKWTSAVAGIFVLSSAIALLAATAAVPVWNLVSFYLPRLRAPLKLRLPRYVEYPVLAERIRRRIDDGTYAINERIPGDAELMEENGASQYAVLMALELLKNLGWLSFRKGEGIFVNPPERRLIDPGNISRWLKGGRAATISQEMPTGPRQPDEPSRSACAPGEQPGETPPSGSVDG